MQFDLANTQPEHVQNILSRRLFDIPEFQRPYEWDTDTCETLWDDISAACESQKEDGYFLGILILTSHIKTGRLSVIDGQQRLISLSLMLRAFSWVDSRNIHLKNCLYQWDRYGANVQCNRITSSVLDTREQECLTKTLTANTPIDLLSVNSKDKYEQNLAFFYGKVSEMPESDRTTLCDYILENVFLLPVISNNIEKSISIFETVNNRGQNLTDGDIFKCILYKHAAASNTQSEFITEWNSLCDNLDSIPTKGDTVTSLFRCYMHLLRGQRGDVSKTVALRTFFTTGNILDISRKLMTQNEYKLTSRSWQETLESLSKIKQAWQLLWMENDAEFRNWVCILDSFQNDIWVYPIVIHIAHFLNTSQPIKLENAAREHCCRFMQNIARYLYSKGFDAASVDGSTIYDEMFAAAVCAAEGRQYDPAIRLLPAFTDTLGGHISVSRFRKGFCAILEQISQIIRIKSGDADGFVNFSEKPNVEHIFPKHWEDTYFDEWRKNNIPNILNTLGNLCLIEKIPNIKAADWNFGTKRCRGYNFSRYSSVKELLNNPTYGHHEYTSRHHRCIERLLQFFHGVYMPRE